MKNAGNDRNKPGRNYGEAMHLLQLTELGYLLTEQGLEIVTTAVIFSPPEFRAPLLERFRAYLRRHGL